MTNFQDEASKCCKNTLIFFDPAHLSNITFTFYRAQSAKIRCILIIHSNFYMQ